jgi:hypothetical protein
MASFWLGEMKAVTQRFSSDPSECGRVAVGGMRRGGATGWAAAAWAS